jgi:hypothetical protein
MEQQKFFPDKNVQRKTHTHSLIRAGPVRKQVCPLWDLTGTVNNTRRLGPTLLCVELSRITNAWEFWSTLWSSLRTVMGYPGLNRSRGVHLTWFFSICNWVFWKWQHYTADVVVNDDDGVQFVCGDQSLTLLWPHLRNNFSWILDILSKFQF